MITRNDFKLELINSMDEKFINCLVDFANSFMTIFPDLMKKEVLINRINDLKYIGFENDTFTCKEKDNGVHDINKSTIIINKKFINDSTNVIKAILYHELIHALSVHSEKDLDLNFNFETTRGGLNRTVAKDDIIIERGQENEVLDEIMTEFYCTQLLKYENITIKDKYVLQCKNFEKDYVESLGLGYIDFAALGPVYDFLFGKQLFQAKFYDGNNFRTWFNEIFSEVGSLKDSLNDYKITKYNSFVSDKNVFNRYTTACEFFKILFKNKYNNNQMNLNELINNNDIQYFISLMIKSVDKMEIDTPKIKDEFYFMLEKFEYDLVMEKLQQNSINNENLSEEYKFQIYRMYKKALKENPNLDFNKLTYQFINDKKHFKGIIINIDNNSYLLNEFDDKQNLNMSEFREFREDMNDVSNELGFTNNNLRYATIYDPTGIHSIIESNGTFYNHSGEEVITSSKYNFITGEELNLSQDNLESKNIK